MEIRIVCSNGRCTNACALLPNLHYCACSTPALERACCLRLGAAHRARPSPSSSLSIHRDTKYRLTQGFSTRGPSICGSCNTPTVLLCVEQRVQLVPKRHVALPACHCEQLLEFNEERRLEEATDRWTRVATAEIKPGIQRQLKQKCRTSHKLLILWNRIIS
jgi:hypothetical protein